MSRFFGKVDMNVKGEIASEYPAWMQRRQIENLEESVASKRRALDRGEIHEADRPDIASEIRKEEKRLDEIKSSRPKFKDKEKDESYKAYKDLCEKVGETMFSRTDMKKGNASASEEARRMTGKCIKVDGQVAEIAREMGIDIEKGMVSRNEADRIRKIVGASLDEETYSERLRREN